MLTSKNLAAPSFHGLSLYQSGILDMGSDQAFMGELIAMVEEAR